MGCNYYGSKDGGTMTVEFRVYQKGERVGKKYSMKIPVNLDCKIYQEFEGDIRER